MQGDSDLGFSGWVLVIGLILLALWVWADLTTGDAEDGTARDVHCEQDKGERDGQCGTAGKRAPA